MRSISSVPSQFAVNKRKVARGAVGQILLDSLSRLVVLGRDNHEVKTV